MFTSTVQNHVILNKIITNMFEYLPQGKMICSDTLGMAFEAEERFEGANGEDIVFDTDFYGRKRPEQPIAGPFVK